MSCPVGGELRASVGAPALGLCGPSELSSLVRERMELSGALELKLPAAADAMAPGSDVAQVLREKIRSKCWSLLGAVSEHPRVGHPDVAERILSFLVEPEALVPSDQGGWMHPGTGSANLDLFFQTVPQSSPQVNHRLHELLAAAWGECPETCLRQVFMVGASREGKQDRYSFYDALLWLWDRQPASVLANLHLMPEVSYWKSLLELVARACEGPRRSLERDQAHAEGTRGQRRRAERGAAPGFRRHFRPGSRLELAEEALRRYDSDPLYRALLERVARLFAAQLRQDLEAMRAGGRVGLCAKWCPSLYHSFDRRTLICESISRWLFPPTLREFEGASEREYAYRAREMLRGVLGELRDYTKSPERLMCQRRWSEINYRAVPALCMRNNADRFAEHDGPRFQCHLDKLASGKAQANVGALMPHELVVQARARESRIPAALNQAQWESLVANLRASGALADCIAVCDVSGSMQCPAGRDSTCMDVAVALSLLLAEVADGSCARKLITFHENPSIIPLPATNNLAELDRFARGMPWGGSTNFYKVFGLLLNMETPPKRVFVFSDMQFSCAARGGTDLQRAREMYQKAGRLLPEIVFWNLAGHKGAPATAGEEGVALVSGFSAGMMKVFLSQGGPQTGLEGLRVLAMALDRPLLRRPRVVFSEAEALDLFRCPEQAVPGRWAAARAPAASGLLGAPTAQHGRGGRWRTDVVAAGTLSCKEAVAAFIGKSGERVTALRATLQELLCAELRACRRGVRAWVDVETKSEPAPRLESGSVKLTVRARVGAGRLPVALELAARKVREASREAEQRARQQKPPSGVERLVRILDHVSSRALSKLSEGVMQLIRDARRLGAEASARLTAPQVEQITSVLLQLRQKWRAAVRDGRDPAGGCATDCAMQHGAKLERDTERARGLARKRALYKRSQARKDLARTGCLQGALRPASRVCLARGDVESRAELPFMSNAEGRRGAHGRQKVASASRASVAFSFGHWRARVEARQGSKSAESDSGLEGPSVFELAEEARKAEEVARRTAALKRAKQRRPSGPAKRAALRRARQASRPHQAIEHEASHGTFQQRRARHRIQKRAERSCRAHGWLAEEDVRPPLRAGGSESPADSAASSGGGRGGGAKFRPKAGARHRRKLDAEQSCHDGGDEGRGGV